MLARLFVTLFPEYGSCTSAPFMRLSPVRQALLTNKKKRGVKSLAAMRCATPFVLA